MILHGGLDDAGGIVGFQELLNLQLLYDAIFAVNDQAAAGAFMTMQAHELRIPAAFTLAVYSGTHMTSLFDPPLATIVQPSDEGGTIPRIAINRKRRSRPKDAISGWTRTNPDRPNPDKPELKIED